MIEMLKEGKSEKRDKLVKVGVERIVEKDLRLKERKGGRGDDIERMWEDIEVKDIIVLIRNGEMGVVEESEIGKRRKWIKGKLKVGLRWKRKDELSGVDIGVDERKELDSKRIEKIEVEIGKKIEIMMGVKRNEIEEIEKIVEKREKGGVEIVEVRIVELEEEERWNGIEGDRLELEEIKVKKVIGMWKIEWSIVKGRKEKEVIL